MPEQLIFTERQGLILGLLLDKPNQGRGVCELSSLLDIPLDALRYELVSLRSLGMVHHVPNDTAGRWLLTARGLEEASKLRAAQSHTHTEAGNGAGSATVSVCHSPEAPAEGRAVVCIGESELDDWWHEQDVEVKADAFLLWTLGTARGAVEEAASVPVTGTICGTGLISPIFATRGFDPGTIGEGAEKAGE